jgi:hypothetical protein
MHIHCLVLLIPFLQPFPMAATNVVLALISGVFPLRRYDTAIWLLVGKIASG